MDDTFVFDTRTPGIQADPYPAFRRLREEDPAHWSPALKGWVLTRYGDVKEAMTGERFSADRVVPMYEELYAQVLAGHPASPEAAKA